jgi:hypothetical protein
MYKPTYDEWMVRTEATTTNGPYTIGNTPVPVGRRSRGFDHAVLDGDNRPCWCGTEMECIALADKWNTSYAMFLMVQGTAAEQDKP